MSPWRSILPAKFGNCLGISSFAARLPQAAAIEPGSFASADMPRLSSNREQRMMERGGNAELGGGCPHTDSPTDEQRSGHLIVALSLTAVPALAAATRARYINSRLIAAEG